MPNLEEWTEKLCNFKCLSENEMRQLCRMALDVMIEEPNVPALPAPAILCGDIHGQFADLLQLLLESGGISASSPNFVFMGDLVDRGFNSVETLSLLLLFKVRFPDKITLIRGNHESRQVTSMYGFYDECMKKYGGPTVWRTCCDVFDCFPIAAIVDGETFCVHGGLSPDLRKIDQMRLLHRRMEIPNEGPFSDLVWSDPELITGWVLSPRGAGHLYGPRVTREFSFINGLTLIARAHQLVQEGYKYHFDEERLVTVWSAPNYCYRCGNWASFLKIHDDRSRQFVIFQEVESQVPVPPPQRPAYFL